MDSSPSQSQQFEIKPLRGSSDLSDDDFQNVDEYEEGDANLHKQGDARSLTKTAQVSRQEPGSNQVLLGAAKFSVHR